MLPGSRKAGERRRARPRISWSSINDKRLKNFLSDINDSGLLVRPVCVVPRLLLNEYGGMKSCQVTNEEKMLQKKQFYLIKNKKTDLPFTSTDRPNKKKYKINFKLYFTIDKVNEHIFLKISQKAPFLSLRVNYQLKNQLFQV